MGCGPSHIESDYTLPPAFQPRACWSHTPSILRNDRLYRYADISRHIPPPYRDPANHRRPTEADTIRILVATDNHVGYEERDPIRKDDSWKSFDEVMSIANAQEVRLPSPSGLP